MGLFAHRQTSSQVWATIAQVYESIIKDLGGLQYKAIMNKSRRANNQRDGMVAGHALPHQTS